MDGLKQDVDYKDPLTANKLSLCLALYAVYI
jgi:hypothetical protein